MDLTKLSGVKQTIALVGVRSELQSQAVLAGVVGQALESSRQVAASGGSGNGSLGSKVNLLA